MNATNTLIGACVAIFIIEILSPNIIGIFAFSPSTFFYEPWTIITSMFLHSGITHLFFNMFALFMFGNMLERKVGTKYFLMVYIASGILGAVGFGLTSPNGAAVGASGAIYGIIGALALLEPNITIFLMGIPMPMYIGGFVYALIELIGMGGSNSFGSNDNIAHSAHLVGLIGGVLTALIWKTREKPKYEWEIR